MKTVILAGGFGTRLSEETAVKPKPMVEIGSRPILMHIMGIYARHGHRDFVVACGYRGDVIKDYFSNFALRHSDWRINLKDGSYEVTDSEAPDWSVDLVDTGLQSTTGERLRRLRSRVGGSRFMMTYGDGLSDLDIGALVEFHESHGKLATVTAVHPPARFGGLEMDGDSVREFSEKRQTREGWINGGFFVFEPGVFDYLKAEGAELERGALECLARDDQLMAFRHTGFWQAMDTLREKHYLEKLQRSGNPPWAIPRS